MGTAVDDAAVLRLAPCERLVRYGYGLVYGMSRRFLGGISVLLHVSWRSRAPILLVIYSS